MNGGSTHTLTFPFGNGLQRTVVSRFESVSKSWNQGFQENFGFEQVLVTFSLHNHHERSFERMINVLSLRQRHESRNRLPLPWNPFLHLQATPLRRGGLTSQHHSDTKEIKASQPLCWIDPSPSLLRYYERGLPFNSPAIDLCVPLETIDQWVLSGFDDSFDNFKSQCPFIKSGLVTWNGDDDRSQRSYLEVLTLNKVDDSGIDYVASTRKRKSGEIQSTLVIEDIRTIFNAMKNNSPPLGNLKFHIVLGTKGQKISPPSYAFESKFNKKNKSIFQLQRTNFLHADGLYVLLKPLRKKRGSTGVPEVPPSNLLDYIMTETPSLNSPWSISGPQYSKPITLQKRYCYSNGDASYSNEKGATLWTMVSFQKGSVRSHSIPL
jgi:hypothetical protein